MSTKQEAAAFTDTAAAGLAGQVRAALRQAKTTIMQAPGMAGGWETWPTDHPAYELYALLDAAVARVNDLAEDREWDEAVMDRASGMDVKMVRVDRLKTDDVVLLDDERWYEVRDVWGHDDEDPEEHDLDPGDVAAIRTIVEGGGLQYTRLALRVIDPERSNEHEIVCKTVGFDAHALLPLQVIGLDPKGGSRG
ncbi:hypothetical protein AB0A05_27180 [Streptomyces sp. NPDC046374]|uniref:hypothetical protein n=1 Tax=Streptomyces sp. NPDC046374 TaxID=3154917 RepID=UPI0033D14749